MKANTVIAAVLLAAGGALIQQARCDSGQQSFTILNQLSNERMVSTMPANGDQNPYGVAFVPQDFPGGGLLEPGDILVSNFNDGMNAQGTGTTIVKIGRSGPASRFFQGTAPLGLTTALGVLRSGFVLVGNVPTDMNGNIIAPGSLLVIDRMGHLVQTLTSQTLLDGPWDLTIHEDGGRAQVYVSNVLSGTVTRLDLRVGDEDSQPTIQSETQIASGYVSAPNKSALIVGPTGLAYDPVRDVLFVASTGDNTIFAVDHARSAKNDGGKGRVVFHDDTHLHGPLGLALAPNGDLITANGDAVNSGDPMTTQNFLVEFAQSGEFVAQLQIDTGMPGAGFGLAFGEGGDALRFAVVNDDTNMLDIWDVQVEQHGESEKRHE